MDIQAPLCLVFKSVNVGYRDKRDTPTFTKKERQCRLVVHERVVHV